MQSRRELDELSDEDLMRMYISGDQRAFEVVYRRRRAGLRRFFERQCRSSAVGTELAQDVWFKLVRACENGNYTAEAKFTTYLYRLAKNQLIDWYRKHGKVQTLEFKEEIDEGEEGAEVQSLNIEDPEKLYASKEHIQSILEAVDSLSDAQRATLLMQIEGDMSYEEIAEAMDTKRETVKTRLRYARDHLKKRLQARELTL